MDREAEEANRRGDDDGPVFASPPRIKGRWSRKAMSNMCRTFLQLDYGPMLALGFPTPITLTYPADWQTVAPNAAAARRHIKAFRKRWQREWGDMYALWKREFQQRGAPHFHLLTVLPTERTKDGRTFKDWLSQTWAQIVNHPDAEERRKHLAAGTRPTSRAADGLKCTDPKRVAIYFSKHGAFGAKAYQDDPPPEWLASGESIGRSWGYWGLKKCTAVAEVKPEDAHTAARVMRGFSGRLVAFRDGWAGSATVPLREFRVPRGVNKATGEVKYRKVRRRVRRMRSGRGWISVNDGPAFAANWPGTCHWTVTPKAAGTAAPGGGRSCAPRLEDCD